MNGDGFRRHAVMLVPVDIKLGYNFTEKLIQYDNIGSLASTWQKENLQAFR